MTTVETSGTSLTVRRTFDAPGDDETALTMEMRFPSTEALDEAVEFGADDGARQTLGRLAEHLTNGGDSSANGGSRA